MQIERGDTGNTLHKRINGWEIGRIGEKGMFTLDALVAVAICSVASLSAVFALHSTLLLQSASIHREIAWEIADNVLESAVQSQINVPEQIERSQNGITYIVTRVPMVAADFPSLIEYRVDVKWIEVDGRQRNIHWEALKAIAKKNG
ncbi:hypothetical protein LSG31_20110 [Fodinisporobacter ferrooxydans]|uniref:Uncharacterized protein n=1 Tax=Fodinisporobacter ferrooxydans TaxID=2901836 RepID=A0ABY4CJF3_9BACL|nr:hypothetical protein LSG31_20110 [Alicyclobacillaceae bacterium MYW30-H2]